MTEAPVAPEETTEEKQETPFSSLTPAAVAGLQNLLRSALKEDISARREEVRKAWNLRLYCRGVQHSYYEESSYIFITPRATGFALPRHMGTYDITSPHKRSFVSILSENPPGINFVPNDLQRAVDVTAAALAEKMRHRVDRLVQMKDRQEKAAGYLCTDGRVVSWVRVEESGKLSITMHGVLESKVPVHTESKDGWDYCILSKEQNIWRAKFENPDFADEIAAASDAGGESMFERYARLAIVANRRGGSVETFKSLVTEHNAWFRPWRYDELAEGVKDELTEAFPEGLRLKAYGDTIVDAVPETMECLEVEHPVDGEGQIRPALLSGMPDIQNAYNDIKNIMRENADYGNPATWVHGGAVDSEALPEQRSEPGAIHIAIPPAGMSMGDCLFQEEPTKISEQTVAMLADLRQDAEFTTGDFPALYGGDTPGQDTVGVNKLLNNQAKGQLGPAWSAIQRLWAKFYPLAIRLVAQRDADKGSIAIQGNNGQESFAPAAILEGEFSCHPDQDSSFPETTADKRASLQNVLGQLGQAGPQGQGIVMQPDNLKLVKQYSGLTDLIIPGAEARDKQLEEIEQLLQESPVPMQGQLEATNGQMPQQQYQSSVAIDPAWDYHAAEADKVQEWLSSRACREEQRKGNLQGIENVKLHGQAHKDELAKQQAGQQAKPEQPKVSLTMQITDPTTIAQFAAAAGATATTPEDIAASQVPDQREQAAKTQHVAAQAQHQAVLAAKEAVAPVKSPNAAPEIEGKEK